MIYFKPAEFACMCGCGLLPKQRIMDIAEQVRQAWGSAIRVTSGARCQNYNNYLRMHGIPAAKYSAHIEGIAVDLVPVNAELTKFHDFLEKHLEVWGVRKEDRRDAKGWGHLDLRPVAPGKSRVFRA